MSRAATVAHTVGSMTATVTPDTFLRAPGRSLISRELFDRLVHRVVTDEMLDGDLAERIIDQTVAFLAACATARSRAPLAPSGLVDIGWHTFLLHTHEYATFCQRIAGRFLHHVPTDGADPTANGKAAREALARTVVAIEAAGFVIDPRLWPSATGASCTGGSCTGCHNGCHEDPPPVRD